MRLVELEVVKRTRALFDRMERHARDAEKAKREKHLLRHEVEMLKRQLARFVPSLELALGGEQKTSDISSARRAQRQVYTAVSRQQGKGLVEGVMMKKELDQLEERFADMRGLDGSSFASPSSMLSASAFASASASASAGRGGGGGGGGGGEQGRGRGEITFELDSAQSKASSRKPRTLASSTSAPLPFRILSSRTPSKGKRRRHLGSPAGSSSSPRSRGSANSTTVKLSALLEKWGSGGLAGSSGGSGGSGGNMSSGGGKVGTGTDGGASAQRPTRDEIVKRRKEMMAKKKRKHGRHNSVQFVDGAAIRVDQDGVKHRFLRVSSVGTTIPHFGASPFVQDETV